MRIESTAQTRPRRRATDLAPVGFQPDGLSAQARGGHDVPSGVDPRVVTAFRPEHPDAQRARDIRAELLAEWASDEGRRQRAVALVALDPGSQVGEIAANLAVSFAQIGRETLLIDADLPAPAQHALLHVENDRGLADALAGQGDIADLARPTAVEGLTLLPAGHGDERLIDAMERRPLLDWVDGGMVRADVVVAAITARGAQEAAGVLARFDSVVPIVRRGRTRTRQLRALLDAMEGRGIGLCGVVLSR